MIAVEPIELAAYAVMRGKPSRIIGFLTVEQAREWIDEHDDWMEFCWSERLFGEWRQERRSGAGGTASRPAPHADAQRGGTSRGLTGGSGGAA